MSGATVSVRGEAIINAKPDAIEVLLEIKAKGSAPDEALREAASRSERLQSILAELDIPTERRSTTHLAVSEEVEHDKQWNARHVGYSATNRTSVTLNDPNLLGRLMKDATEQAQARIIGPWWRINLDNPARVRACEEAASEARRKATAYAKALGATLAGVIDVFEPDFSYSFRQRNDRFAIRETSTTALWADVAGTNEIPLQVGELDVAAVVAVKFALEQE